MEEDHPNPRLHYNRAAEFAWIERLAGSWVGLITHGLGSDSASSNRGQEAERVPQESEPSRPQALEDPWKTRKDLDLQ